MQRTYLNDFERVHDKRVCTYGYNIISYWFSNASQVECMGIPDEYIAQYMHTISKCIHHSATATTMASENKYTRLYIIRLCGNASIVTKQIWKSNWMRVCVHIVHIATGDWCGNAIGLMRQILQMSQCQCTREAKLNKIQQTSLFVLREFLYR